MKIVVVDPINGTIESEDREIPSITIVNGMYVKELNMMPAAYVYKAEHRAEITLIINELNRKRKVLQEEEGKIYYRILPQFRAG